MNSEKTTKSGKLLELDFYPEGREGQLPQRARKEKQSSEEQQAYNKVLSVKKVVRMVNANFEENDYFITLTFDTESAPKDYNDAHRLVNNYLRRVKRKAEKAAKDAEAKTKLLEQELANDSLNDGLVVALEELQRLNRPLKYLYVISTGIYESGPFIDQISFHVHMFLTSVLARGVVEELWKYGNIARFSRYAPERYGPEAAAKYLALNKLEGRRFSHSNNFSLPIEEKNDKHMSYSDLLDLCKNRSDDKTYWEARYPGYRFVRAEKRFNRYNSKWYLSVVMYRT